jgi:hypothetical protein
MDEEEIKLVHEAIKTYGDGFWNSNPFNDEEGNEMLFDEVVTMVNKNGYDLKLVKKEC